MESNEELVEYLKKTDRIETEKVKEAFENVDRRDFVPSDKEKWAYKDQALPLAEDSTISAPHMVAINTENLEVKENDKVLEVGSGSGYQLAILSQLADEVVGIEINSELVEKSRRRLKGFDNVKVVEGNGLDPVDDRYDKILFSAAIKDFEPALKYIKDDGVILAPVIESSGQVLEKWKDGNVEKISKVRFVEMKN